MTSAQDFRFYWDRFFDRHGARTGEIQTRAETLIGTRIADQRLLLYVCYQERLQRRFGAKFLHCGNGGMLLADAVTREPQTWGRGHVILRNRVVSKRVRERLRGTMNE